MATALSLPAKAALPIRRSIVKPSRERLFSEANYLRTKYGGSSTKHSRRAFGSTLLTNHQNSKYTTQIGVGTPSTTFSVMIDTGSSDLVLATQPCQAGCLDTTPLYDPALSTSSINLQKPFSVKYGSGSADGYLAQDAVSISGFTVEQQTFGACTETSSILSDNITGLLGLGFSQLAASGAVPIVEQLSNSGQLDDNVFTVQLLPQSEESMIAQARAESQAITAPGGVLTVGYIDSTLFTGEINYIPINTPASYWNIPIQAVAINGVDIALTEKLAAIDTGTALIAAPAADCESVYSQIPGGSPVQEEGYDGFFYYKCTSNPNLSFTFGSVNYIVSSDNFNIQQYNDTFCIGAVFSITSDHVDWVLGDVFLTGVYSIFRFAPTPSVGFAALRGDESHPEGVVSKGSNSASSFTIPCFSIYFMVILIAHLM